MDWHKAKTGKTSFVCAEDPGVISVTQIYNSIDYKFEEKDFRLSMLEDQMASEKLSEGITGFSNAIEELEELLLNRYSEIKNHKLISAN